MDTYKVIFFGDSICYGQGVSLFRGWVPRIASRLEDNVRRYNFQILVTNASVNGNTTRLALERMPYEIQATSPDILIVQFGMNDCNYWETDHGIPRVSPKAFAANLEEIITRAFNFEVKHVILNTNHPTLRNQTIMAGSHITYQESNESYNRLIRLVAGLFADRVILNDIEVAVQNAVNAGQSLESLLQPDSLHLSEKGHDLYFDVSYPIVWNKILQLANA